MAFLFTKQPAEIRVIGVDFVDRLADEDTIDEAIVSAINLADGADAAEILDGSASIDGTQVAQTIGSQADDSSGDTTEGEYKVTVLVTTAGGETLEEDIVVIVKEL